MATVSVYTAARTKEIEDAAVVDGEIIGDDLVLKRFDETTFIAGDVRGPVGPIGIGPVPSGTIIMGSWPTDPAGYLILDGSLVVGGVFTYPDLAAAYPSWVVGGNLQLPNPAGAVPMGGPTPGVVSGSMFHTLTSANLAPHQHTGPSHQHSGPNHNHSIDHTHGTGSTGYSGTNHAHTIPNHTHPRSADTGGVGYVYRGSGASGFDVLNAGSGVQLYYTEWPGTDYSGGGGLTSYESSYHSHSASVPTHNGSSGPGGTGLTGAAGTGATSSTGSGTPVNHTPKTLSVKYAVKT